MALKRVTDTQPLLQICRFKVSCIVVLESNFTRVERLRMSIVSSPMDTVTESKRRTNAKAFAMDVFIDQEQKLGDRR